MKSIKTLITLCLICVAVSFVYAAIDGAQLTEGPSSRANDTTSGNATAYAGNVTEVNLTTSFNTERWAGFYGDISAGLQLGDADGNLFYNWTVGNLTGTVIFATNGSTTFSNITPANDSNLPAFVVAPAFDNFTSTFASVENFSNSGTIGNVENVSYTVTNQVDTDNSLKTYAMFDGTDGVVVMATIVQDDAMSFQNQTVDYQILLPADTSGEQYFFYMELP